MAEEEIPSNPFWAAVEQATDPTAYKPLRSEHIEAVRLEVKGEPYYVLKEPHSKNYLRLTEGDYALWWQMNGRKSLKDLLFYNLMRFRTLPIGHLNTLVANLRQGHFLQDKPTNLYTQLDNALTERAPTGRGERLIKGFLRTDISIGGLDDFFTPLYKRFRWLFYPPVQLFILLVITMGAFLFYRQVVQENFSLSGETGLGVFTFFFANLIVIGLHEVGHGLATKHYGRELNRGGFLIYWGMPAFYVDTRDTWMSPSSARIVVSWAGPHSGLMIGAVVGGLLTAVTTFYPQYQNAPWANFLYQIGFIAYLSVLLNLNPLLELDGYFILMDWLELPGLRSRAIQFWRAELWPKLRATPRPGPFWQSLNPTERIFTTYGLLTLLYSTYALYLAVYFWRTRLVPFMLGLWGNYGPLGKLLVLLIITLIVVPAIYFLLLASWERLKEWLNWLARHNLLARPDVLAFLVGVPLFAGASYLLVVLPTGLATVLMWFLHLTAVAAFAGVARQLPGSRFQWAMWALTAVTLGLTLTYLSGTGWVRDGGVLLTAGAVLAAGIISWATVTAQANLKLTLADRGLMLAFFLIGLFYTWNLERTFLNTFILLNTFVGLIFLTPLLVNFSGTYFSIPWMLITLGILGLPWLRALPILHQPILLIWLYAGLLYLLLGTLAEFKRHETNTAETEAAFSERQRLIHSFNHFLEALLTTYEMVFGVRRLRVIYAQMVALGPLDPDASILQIAEKCRAALLLAVDRLDDLAGTPFTRKAGQAAYDSLGWLDAETLARHVLSEMEWGSQLAEGFIKARDGRSELIRKAEIFAGFDQDAVQEVLKIAKTESFRPGHTLAQAGQEATRFYLIESGEVSMEEHGHPLATLTAGGYFGIFALLDKGVYRRSYRTLSPVQCLVIERDRFDPLLRADTSLAKQVNEGHKARQLLKDMPLFSSLSPQELAVLDARLVQQIVERGEVIVHQGAPRSHLYIVASGQVEVLVTNEQGTQKLGNLGPGEHFGEYALFADTPYTATYIALSRTELWLLDEAKFDQLVANYQDLSHYVEQIGSGRLIATQRQAGLGGIFS